MKKVLTVLVVLMVTAAAVFAIDDATIKVKTTIVGADPVYALAQDTTEAAAGETKEVTVSDLLTASKTLQFAVKQTADSNKKVSYKLTVTATDLVLSGGSGAAYEKFTVDTATPTLTEVSKDGYSANVATNVLTLNYNGKKVVAGNVATFSLTWAANADAAEGSYEATVKLAVEAL